MMLNALSLKLFGKRGKNVATIFKNYNFVSLSFLVAGLEAHNKKRSLHRDTAPLAWDENLAEASQKWANYLAHIDKLQHDKSNSTGENLYMFGTSGTVDEVAASAAAVDSW